MLGLVRRFGPLAILVTAAMTVALAQEKKQETPSGTIGEGQRVFTCAHSFHFFAEVVPVPGSDDAPDIWMTVPDRVVVGDAKDVDVLEKEPDGLHSTSLNSPYLGVLLFVSLDRRVPVESFPKEVL